MLLSYKALVEKQSGHQIIKLKSDNWGEYVNNKFTTFCTEQGIQQQDTIPYTPQQNVVAEWKNHTLKEMTNCMIQSKGLIRGNLGSKMGLIRKRAKISFCELEFKNQ